MRWTSRVAISLLLLTVAGVARAGTEEEVTALFAKFVAAQNAHDLKAVGELLQDFDSVPLGHPWRTHLGSRCSTQALRGAVSGHLVS